MKTPVLLLKTRSTPHDGYEEYFSKGEYDPVFIPVLQHCFNHENLRAVKELFISGAFGNRGGQKAKEKYGGLIFTSQRAVEGFAQMVMEIGGMICLPFCKTSHTPLLTDQNNLESDVLIQYSAQCLGRIPLPRPVHSRACDVSRPSDNSGFASSPRTYLW